MKYFKNEQTEEVFGYYETDETQLPYIEAAVNAAWVDVTNSWPPPPATPTIAQQIQTLEATVTDRRVREAVLGTDNGWLKNLDDQIAALRAQLTKETTNG